MSYTTKQREQYNKDRQITCRVLEITETQYNRFRRLGEKIRKEFEDQCNGLSEEMDRESNAVAYQLGKQVKVLASANDLHYFIQTDPRGATIYLSKEPIYDNNYNRFGSYCII